MLKKYYVATAFYRTAREKEQSFVEARTGAEAASKVLGGKWMLRASKDIKDLCHMAIVYRLNSYDRIGEDNTRLNVATIRFYQQIEGGN